MQLREWALYAEPKHHSQRAALFSVHNDLLDLNVDEVWKQSLPSIVRILSSVFALYLKQTGAFFWLINPDQIAFKTDSCEITLGVLRLWEKISFSSKVITSVFHG